MYRALLAAVTPPASGSGVDTRHPPPVDNDALGERETAGRQGTGGRELDGEFHFDRRPPEHTSVDGCRDGSRADAERPGGACTAANGGSASSAGGKPSERVPPVALGRGGGRGEGLHGTRVERGGDQFQQGNASLPEAAAAAAVEAASACPSTRPFDLVVVDVGSLGGLDFAQALVRIGENVDLFGKPALLAPSKRKNIYSWSCSDR